MNNRLIEREREEVIAKYGAWTDHNIRLTDELYTMSPDATSPKLRRIVQIVSDLARKPVSELRILDLACLEGGYAIEFARQGATVVAIEGRETNIEKAKFAKRVLGLDNLTLVSGKVQMLNRAEFGSFDVVLCLGILYHLDSPDVFSFLESIADVCTGFVIVDTYVSLSPKVGYQYKGKPYWGRDIIEHMAHESSSERLDKLWTSIGNAKSVWLTQATLTNLLVRFGFTSVYDCSVPVELNKPLDRITLVAVKGSPASILSTNITRGTANELPEKFVRRPSHHQRIGMIAAHRLTRLVPWQVRRALKHGLGRLGLRRGPASDRVV